VIYSPDKGGAMLAAELHQLQQNRRGTATNRCSRNVRSENDRKMEDRKEAAERELKEARTMEP
jgi:hypothetical protein